MAATSPRVDELVQSVSLHNARRWMFNGYIMPFMILESLWISCWTFVYGIDEYYDAGLVGIATIGVLQVLLCLCCQWSVHIHTFVNCSSVSEGERRPPDSICLNNRHVVALRVCSQYVS